MRGSARGALGLPLPLPLLLAALVVAACVRRTQHLAPAAGVAALGTPELIQEIVREALVLDAAGDRAAEDRKSTRLNSSHPSISYAVFCLKKKNKKIMKTTLDETSV